MCAHIEALGRLSPQEAHTSPVPLSPPWQVTLFEASEVPNPEALLMVVVYTMYCHTGLLCLVYRCWLVCVETTNS